MKLYLGGSLAFYTPTKQPNLVIQLSDVMPLAQVINNLGIPIAEIQLTVLNGELVNLDDTLVSNIDEIRLYPPVGGG